MEQLSVLANPILYDKPIPNIKGKLSLWEFDDGDLSHLMSIMRLNKSGYAGINKQGQIVDRREFPDAVPVGKNSIFGVAEPKDL